MSKIQKKGNESYLKKRLVMVDEVLIKISNSADRGMSEPEIIDFIEKNYPDKTRGSGFNRAKFLIKQLKNMGYIENETNTNYKTTVEGLFYNLNGGYEQEIERRRQAEKERQSLVFFQKEFHKNASKNFEMSNKMFWFMTIVTAISLLSTIITTMILLFK